MKIFKILENDVKLLADILFELPFKHQPLIVKGIEILKALEEINEEIKE